MTESPFVVLQNTPTAASYSPVPKVIAIAITGRCQLRCRHCFNESGPENDLELPLDVIERVLDEAVSWGVRQIRVNGGEPTYHHRFRDVVGACASRNLGISLNTHGVYPSEMLEYLKTASIDHFLVSIDGLETQNDFIRGHGTFRRAVRSCRELRQAGQRVMISCHVGERNATDAPELVRLAAELDLDIKFSPIRPVGRAARELVGSLPRPETYRHVVEAVTRLRRELPRTKIVTDFDVLDDAAADACERDPGMSSCKAGRTMVNVSYDGSIYPCAFFETAEREFSAGSVYLNTVGEVWENSPALEPFRTHTKSSTCQSCGHYRRSCAGGCPAVAHFATGYLDALDPICFADKDREEVPQ